MQRTRVSNSKRLLLKKEYVGVESSCFYGIVVVADYNYIRSSYPNTSISDFIEKKTKLGGDTMMSSMSKTPRTNKC